MPEPASPIADASPAPADAEAGGRDAGAGQPPDMPEPGTAFSACTESADCDEGLLCTSSGGWMGNTWATTGYCTAYCAASDVAVDDCPQPSSGLVKASCQFGMCLLESCERLQCPSGMHCMSVPVGSGQVVSVFACQP